MALRNAFGGLALDETLKGLIEKFRDKKEPLFITNGEDPLIVESRPRPDPTIASQIRAIPGSTSIVSIAGQNNNRAGLSVYNNSSATLYVVAGAGVVSSTFFTVLIAASGYWELPSGVNGCYKGPITGLWATATGTGLVTEYA